MSKHYEINKEKIPTEAFIFSIEERKQVAKDFNEIFKLANKLKPKDFTRSNLVLFLYIRAILLENLEKGEISQIDAIDAAIKAGVYLKDFKSKNDKGV